jgi:hypothetical protein
MTKQAWYVRYTYGYNDKYTVELTGRCKKTTGGPDDIKPRYSVEIQKYFFGYKWGTKWVCKEHIVICDPITEEIHECDCFKDDENVK